MSLPMCRFLSTYNRKNNNLIENWQLIYCCHWLIENKHIMRNIYIPFSSFCWIIALKNDKIVLFIMLFSPKKSFQTNKPCISLGGWNILFFYWNVLGGNIHVSDIFMMLFTLFWEKNKFTAIFHFDFFISKPRVIIIYNGCLFLVFDGWLIWLLPKLDRSCVLFVIL